MSFKSVSKGIATANQGVYYTTEDGGLNWKSNSIAAKNNLGSIYFNEDRDVATISADSLVILNSPFEKLFKPANAYKLLFLNPQQVIGIGNHYEKEFWPYGDILISNNNLKDFTQKSYAPGNSFSFDAIGKMGDHKIMIIGTGLNGPTIITLNI